MGTNTLLFKLYCYSFTAILDEVTPNLTQLCGIRLCGRPIAVLYMFRRWTPLFIDAIIQLPTNPRGIYHARQ